MEKTVKDVINEFHKSGTSVADWAAKNKFSPWLVYAILRGNRKCLRGESHKIAVALGIKKT